MDEYKEKCKECAAQGVALMAALAANGILMPLYLYARESKPGKPGQLLLAGDTDAPCNGFALVTGEGLRAGVPYDGYFQWVSDRARGARILAID